MMKLVLDKVTRHFVWVLYGDWGWLSFPSTSSLSLAREMLGMGAIGCSGYGVYGADMGYMGQCTTAGLHRGCVYGPPSTGYMEHHSRDGEWANTVTLVVVDKEVDEEGEDKDEMMVMKESMWG